MQINQIQTSNQITDNRKTISYKGGREILRTFANPDSLVSTIAIESAVTGGRSANAYQRGGFTEFRERITEEVISAVFWMKGVDIFNKIGDKIGEHVFKLPTTEFDVGKDALRTPFANLSEEIARQVKDPKKAKALQQKLAVFKFSKVILSALLATGFVGFALPKINQGITNKLMARKNADKKDESAKSDLNNNYNCYESFEDFDKRVSKNNAPSFKGGAEVMTIVAHCLENNRVCKMLTTDAGILTGRVTSARNKDEAIEYAFRDSTAPFFYYASTPLIYKGLQALTKSANMTELDSVASKQVHNIMLEQLKNTDGTFTSMNVKDFAVKTIGVLDDRAKDLIGKLPFKSDVISLTELSKHITDENLLKKAAEMAKLQPKQAGVGSVLTKQQVADVLKSGSINTPEFMQKIFKDKFGEALTNPHKFISMKKITSFRTDIDKYAQSIIDAANKTNGGVVDKQLLEKISKKSFFMSAGFRAVAMGVSALMLGLVLPKIQYAITAKRTGSNAAPGLRNVEEQNKTETKKA